MLARYREAYHEGAVQRWSERKVRGDTESTGDAAASIHDLEDAYLLEQLPAADVPPRSLLREVVCGEAVSVDDLESGEAPVLWEASPRGGSLGSEPGRDASVEEQDGRIIVAVEIGEGDGGVCVTKRLVFAESGMAAVEYEWPADRWPVDAHWTVEVRTQSEALPTGAGARVGSYPVVTVPRSERGFERIVQGYAHVFQWPVGSGRAVLEFRAGSEAAGV